MGRSCESLSRRQRQLTTPAMCDYLIGLVRERCRTERFAALWVRRDTYYWRYWPMVEIWGLGRDARKYVGPLPIIAHPPCGPWGKYRSRCDQSREDGVIAMRLVHEFGGVVEQPLGSSLYKECGDGRDILLLNQSDYGHMALKPTILYVVDKH